MSGLIACPTSEGRSQRTRFKKLTEEWVDLSIELSKLNMLRDNKRGSE
jgi:hypothetical protein